MKPDCWWLPDQPTTAVTSTCTCILKCLFILSWHFISTSFFKWAVQLQLDASSSVIPSRCWAHRLGTPRWAQTIYWESPWWCGLRECCRLVGGKWLVNLLQYPPLMQSILLCSIISCSTQHSRVSKMARDYLAIQGSATPSERAFLSGGTTGTAKCNHLKLEAFEALQLLKSAYRNGHIAFPFCPKSH